MFLYHHSKEGHSREYHYVLRTVGRLYNNLSEIYVPHHVEQWKRLPAYEAIIAQLFEVSLRYLLLV